MKLLGLYMLALLGGVFLAVQAGFSSQLGTLLKQPVLAVIFTSLTSAVLGILFVLFWGKPSFQMFSIPEIPWYLWWIGGLFSMAGISLYFYAIPKVGISKIIALGLCGQLVFSLIAGNFGWLNLPVEPITPKRLIGAIAMTLGILLINTK